MNLNKEFHDLLKITGPGHMMMTAYDTAWISRLRELNEPLGEQALEWLREHQLPDGSWGAPQPYYFHDRAICTLAAMNALAQRGRARDRERLRRAEAALEIATNGLTKDPAGETIGFELIVPTLLHEAKAIGAIHSQEYDVLKQLTPRRAAKLAILPHGMISRYVTAAFSAEMAGYDGRQLLDVENLQEVDGSVSHSPSATAYFALYVRRRDPKALQYLHKAAKNGMAPNVFPFNIFERSWVLWNLNLTGALDDEMHALCQPHLDFLQEAWKPGEGVCWTAGHEPRDGDDTAVTFTVLSSLGRMADVEALWHYERDDHFLCFPLESNPSISTQIHILSALRQAGVEIEHPAIQKVIRFLVASRTSDAFWFDKWHASPYYTTAQAVIACVGENNLTIARAIEWIINTQSESGAWGYYMPTAEETAYCLQALTIWRRCGGQVPDHVLERGAHWLMDHAEPPYPPLWLGKCLYCPEVVVRSAILSALMLVDQK